ncbi:MAG: S53 family peptidase [Clostridia bacterium]|nr:S53 family peptidase [Clostridia bacterium]
MICERNARFPLSEHVFRPHYNGGVNFEVNRVSGYTPSMLRHAYAFSSSFTGKGVKIAVVVALDNVGIEENMAMFCHQFSLPVPVMSVYYPDGRAENTSRNWLVESSLDTQWAHVFAPDAEILVVFAIDARVESLLSAARYASETLGADIVSMSFGTEESGVDENLTSFMSDAKSVFVASSGDRGGIVSFPSSSPNCISVGGTNLVLNNAGTSRILETAWTGGGGGKSDVFEIPPWQGRFFNIYGMAEGMRGTPDVSMMANLNPGAAAYVAQLGGWTTVGGTSFACACFVGICACIKEKNNEIKTSSDMQYFLYGKAGNVRYDTPQYNFNDITLGRSGSFYAQVGWDFASGLGSPVINQLLQD